jgi:lipid-binding SYLF domain-containing protein
MSKFRVMLLAAGLGLAGVAAPRAWAASDQQQVVDRARLTIEDMMKDREFGNSPQLLRRARAVMIIPRIFKAGFFFGGAGGQGVLLARDGAGWSNPAFYTIGSASFGLQIGAQESEMILFIMSPKALSAVMHNQFKVGAEAGLAVVTLGSSAEAATAGNLNADIIAWASSTGAFAGISLDGSILKPDHGDDRAYYGRPLTTSEIVFRHAGMNAGADGLRRSLSVAG